MKRINQNLFNQLKRLSTHMALGWYIERKDGLKLGFTSADIPFWMDGLRYEPSNAFSGMAVSSKSNLSVDNTSTTALISDKITQWDLQAGLWDNAYVRMFWVNPHDPQGAIPIRGGRLGEVKIKNGEFEAELRSPFQRLQQPFGNFYTLECPATLGDSRCKVWLEAEEWKPNERYIAKAGADAGIGSYVKPTEQTGYWYQCVGAQGQQGAVTSNPLALAVLEAGKRQAVNPYIAFGIFGFFKLGIDAKRIKSGELVVTSSSPEHHKWLATVLNGTQFSANQITVEGMMPFGESFYQDEFDTQGNPVNSQEFLTPTKEGKVPKSAPDGVRPLTVTNLSSSVTYAIGRSGAVEPDWPQMIGAEVTDNQLVWRCIRARRLRGIVTAVFSRSHFTDSSREEPAEWWRYGTVEWLTGANKGLKVEVRSYGAANGGAFALLEQMPGPIMPGDEYEVIKGCAKTRTACKELDNIHNYRGFPDMPTEEKALATANITSKGGKKKQDSGGS